MIIQFKDRTEDLRELNKILSSKKFEFIVIYGRRRIGKTALALEATKRSKRIYFLATRENNMERFYNTCTKQFPEISKLRKDYEIIFDFLKDNVDVIIIDEFQNMIQENKNIISIFQAIVDTILINSKVKLFLIGSSVSLMTSKVLSYKSPLYGRKTASIKLKTIPFIELKKFFPKKSFEKLLNIYGFSGGIPFYLTEIKGDFWNWLKEETERESSFVKDEIDFLMRYEFEDVSTYKLILQAIAFGKTKINEIKDFIKVKRTDIMPYLSNLILTEFVERKVPITENIKSRKGRYFLKDNFLKFWFRFVYPNLSSIEEKTFDINLIKNEFPSYLGFIFEDVSMQMIKHLNFFKYTKIGRQWGKIPKAPKGKNQYEIDIVALNEQKKEILFGECKWKNKVNAQKIAKQLDEKTKYVQWYNNERKETLAIFAKSFSKKIRQFNNKPVKCFDLKDLEKLLKK